MARTFDGTNDIINFGNTTALNTATAFTIMLWIACDEAGATANDGILGKNTNAGTQGFCWILNNSGAGFRFFIGAPNYVKTTLLADTAYHHVAIVYDGAGAANADRLKVYLDAVLQTADSFSGTIAASVPDAGATNFNLGRPGGDLGFGAFSAAHLKVWTAALSAGEVLQELYSYLPVRQHNLLLWSPCDNGNAVDYSGNGFNGTITEATETTGPGQVLYGNSVVAPTRSPRGTRRSNLQGFRRLGPHVPLITRGV